MLIIRVGVYGGGAGREDGGIEDPIWVDDKFGSGRNFRVAALPYGFDNFAPFELDFVFLYTLETRGEHTVC